MNTSPGATFSPAHLSDFDTFVIIDGIGLASSGGRAEARGIADRLAANSGARLLLTSDAKDGVVGADFIYTGPWLSICEPEREWGERIELLLPYQVNSALMEAAGNPAVKFMHCLPALHNRETEVGEAILDKWHLDGVEVSEEVFESEASIVFDQAENRLHTIKALLVTTHGA